ncbi:SET domain-containing protein [Xylariaceae sp. FL0255]|nr:SET domain-containing protein [Xylariaceae sp. FL0255]
MSGSAESGAEKGVEVKESAIPNAGRGLFATKSFSPGDIVFAVDRPLVSEVNAEHMADTCAWCCQRAATDPTERVSSKAMGLPSGLIEVKSCTGCKRVSYCSKKCQAKAWKREHKYECAALKPADREDVSSHVRAVVKILGRMKVDRYNETLIVSEMLKFPPVGDSVVQKAFKEQDEERYKELNMLGNGAWIFAEKPDLGGTDNDTTVGFGFDPTICAANHSCDPNATLVNLQPRVELRALKPIKVGDEITFKYTETTAPFSLRQADLKTRYLFDCQCSKCKKGFDLDQLLQPASKLAGEYLKTADQLVLQHQADLAKHLMPGDDEKAQMRLAAMQATAYSVLEDLQSSLDDVKEMIQLCVGSGMWSWTRQPVPALTRRLFERYLASGNLYKAFRIGMKLHIEILPQIYPQSFYPDRLILAWTISTIINVLSGPAMAEIYKSFAQNGLELRLIYYGFLFYCYENTPLVFGYNSSCGRLVEHTYKQVMAGTSVERATIEANIVNVWPSFETLARNVDVTNF